MIIDSVFMELRSRLRSCNVYITTTVDFTKNCNLKINIQSNNILLNYYNTDSKSKSRRDSLSSIESLSDSCSDDDDVTEIIPIEEYCKIIPNSMSGLKIDKNNISFRILTEPKNGNFYNEVLTPTNSTSNSINDDFKINLNVQEPLKFVCCNCSNVLSLDSVKFDRILELPSDNLDISEWFCHGHNSNDIALKPSKYDLLYRLTFVLVNNSLMSQKTNSFNSKRNIYHCNRCLAWLGMKNNDTVKLYNSTVKIITDSEETTIFKYKNKLDNATSNDFVYTIESMTKEFNLGFQYSLMCKIVLECTISGTTKNYLLIWVMDKELQVLRNTEYIRNDGIKLVSSFLSKILYKIESSTSEEVENWLADSSVVCTEISKSMFYDGIEHLKQMSLKVPESFRVTNGYSVSYLNV